MSNYPIENLMNSAMNSIKEMVDVNTIIGDPIETSNNIVIIPVSKVNFGFAAGGSEFKVKGLSDKKEKNKEEKEEENKDENVRLPFGGGSGAGVSISPIAFIAVQPSGVKLLPVTHSSSLDKLLDLVPDLIEKTTQMIEKKLNKSGKKVQDNLIVKVNEEKKPKDNSKTETEEEEPSSITEVESKPYEVEYDETDM